MKSRIWVFVFFYETALKSIKSLENGFNYKDVTKIKHISKISSKFCENEFLKFAKKITFLLSYRDGSPNEIYHLCMYLST